MQYLIFKHTLESFTVSEERVKVLQKLGYIDLVAQEYRRLFQIILSLYQEAKKARNVEAQKVIRENFLKYKKEISKSKALSGKFYIIFKLMCINYSCIDLYSIYKTVK